MTGGPFSPPPADGHSHVFLGAGHDRNARKTWAVIWLCGAMMVAEIVGGSVFGSLALVADGLHMSTHAGALLLAALAYGYARRHAKDPRFVFGTGKLGDLAGFSSAIVLAMIALLILYEAAVRLVLPVGIDFDEAIALASVGLLVNIASAWLLSGDAHDHHGHHHGGRDHHDEVRRIRTASGVIILQVFEQGVPPRFRIAFEPGSASLDARDVSIETTRPDGTSQVFTFVARETYLESVDEIPEPHAFIAMLRIARGDATHEYRAAFTESDHGAGEAGSSTHRDNNMRAAFVHVVADAAVSVLAIVGLAAGKYLGWVFMDPVMGIAGALVIASWSYRLLKDAGAMLLDMSPDRAIAESIRRVIEGEGDHLADLHIWRLGPGHLGAIVSVITGEARGPDFYHARLGRFGLLSHVTVEVRTRGLVA